MGNNAIQQVTRRPIERQDTAPSRMSSWTYRPHVDIYDTPEEVILLADVPGSSGDNINVSFEAGIVTIESQVPPRHPEHARAVLQEYGIGNFHRRFEIDDTIDTEGVAAEYRNGVLTVHLPKVQQARRRRVPVKS